jgi:hypothetical protein
LKTLSRGLLFQKAKWIRFSILLQAISKMQITFKDKARADEKAQHTREYVSILKRLATP